MRAKNFLGVIIVLVVVILAAGGYAYAKYAEWNRPRVQRQNFMVEILKGNPPLDCAGVAKTLM